MIFYFSPCSDNEMWGKNEDNDSDRDNGNAPDYNLWCMFAKFCSK